MRTARPNINTPIVREPHPFHSFSRIPQTLLNVTFSDISILQENASNIGLPPKKLLPISSPKNRSTVCIMDQDRQEHRTKHYSQGHRR